VVTSGRSLGTNLSGIAQWSTQDPFIDYFKAARPWVTQKTDVWDTEEQARLDVDPNGWVKSLPGATSTAQFRQVGTLVVPAGEAARPGKYVVVYDGVGEITYGLGGAKSTASPPLGGMWCNWLTSMALPPPRVALTSSPF
jgi:hypothetical protein